MHSFALRAAMGARVLSEKKISPDGPCYIHLKGRQAGFWGFIKSLLGISSYITLDVYEDYISSTQDSASGKMSSVIPITQIANVGYGYLKPVLCLILAVIMFVLTLMLFGLYMDTEAEVLLLLVFITSIMCIGFVLIYFLQKTLCIFWNSVGALGGVIFLKRSLIENKSMTEEEAGEICDTILALVRHANSK